MHFDLTFCNDRLKLQHYKVLMGNLCLAPINAGYSNRTAHTQTVKLHIKAINILKP